MFKIYLLDSGNFSSLLYDDRHVFYPAVLEPELEYNGDNGILIGKLTFQLRDLTYANMLRLLRHTVIVTQMIGGVETVIFRGRPLLRDDDDYNDQIYTFEGILAGLNDTLQVPSIQKSVGYGYHLKNLIARHNSLVLDSGDGNLNRVIDNSAINRNDPACYIHTIEGEPYTDSLAYKAGIDPVAIDYIRYRASTMDHLKTQYVDVWGGYFYIANEPLRLGQDGKVTLQNTLKYVDVYSNLQSHVNTQRIEFGKNLISIKRSVSADNFATVLVPIGASLNELAKTWPYYQSTGEGGGWKIRKITHSPDDYELINYSSRGAYIDAETGKEKTTSNQYYMMPPDVNVEPGEIFYLSTYLEGLSTEFSIAAYAILSRDGQTLYSLGPTVRNSKDSNDNVEVKTLALSDERIEIPEDTKGTGLKLRLCRFASSNDPNPSFVLKKFNKNYMEENVTIMSEATHLDGVIQKRSRFDIGRDVYPDATETLNTPEAYEESKRVYNQELFEIFGSIEKTIEFSDFDIDHVSVIYARASIELEKMGEDLEIEIQAADLSYIDESEEAFQPYDLVPVVSEPHNLDMMLPIIKMTLPLSDPASATYTLQNDIHLTQDSKKYISQMVSSPSADMQKNQTVVVYNGGGSGSGSQGPPGPAGYSPTVAVTAITGGHTVTITDQTGSHPFNVMDGEDGQDGADGVSPAVTVTPIEGGNRITITDKSHPSGISFNVMDGEDGSSSDLKHTATIQKYNGSWRLVSDGTTMSWTDLWNNQADDMTLITVDGSNIRHLHKTGIEFTSGSTINSVNIYFSDQRYNGRTAEGNVYRLTVPSDGSTGTIAEITGADIPTSGGSGSAPYEIPITYTDMWVSSRSSDEIYAHADNCILNVDGVTMEVLSAERYVEDGDQFVRIVAIDYTSFDSTTNEFTAWEIIAQNSDTYTPIISKYEYDTKDLIHHKIFFYNESTGAITKSAGGAATGSDISGLLISEYSVYIVGFVMKDGELSYLYYEPMDDSVIGGSSGSVRFYRSTDAGMEILTIPARSSTATKTTVPSGNADCHLKITATYNSASQSYTFDKTASEIIAAVSAGQIPVVTVASTGTGGQFTNDQWMYAESSFDGEDTYIKFYSLRQNGDVEYMMYVDSEQSAYTYLYQTLPPATAANNGKIPKIVNGRWTISDLSSDDKHHTFYYRVNNDDWDLDYDEITSLLASGYDIQCKITCGNSDFYAPVRRYRTRSQEGDDFYSFDVLTYHYDTDKMWWMSVHVYNTNGRTQVAYYEGEFAPEDPPEAQIVYINILDDGSMEYEGASINCEDVAAMSRSGKTVIGRFDPYSDESYLCDLYLTETYEQGSITFTGFVWRDNTWSICVADCDQGDVLDVAYIPVVDSTIIVYLNSDGTINRTAPAALSYTEVKNRLNRKIPTCLLVNQDETRTRIYSTEQMSITNNGPIVFAGPIRHANGNITEAVFLLDSSNNLTVSYTARENALRKVTNLASYYASTEYYPSVKGVWDTFQRKPVIVWEVQDVSQGLLALNTNISSSLAWQLTNLDLTPFKRIKIYVKAGRKTGALAADSSITPASIIEMSLDDRAKETVTQNAFIASSVVQNPNDPNRLGLITCAVSGDKTKFAVLRATTLYGTAATSNTDAYPYVFLIEGYYD